MLKKGVVILIALLVIPITFAGLQEDIEALDADIREFVGDKDIVIVEGTYATLAEKSTLFILKEGYDKIKNAPTIPESQFTGLEDPTDVIIYVGGPTQNVFSAQVMDDPSYTSEIKYLSIGRAVLLESPESKVMVMSDFAGFGNLPKTNLEKSPLASFMPIEYVPAAATVIGVGIMWMWLLIAKLFLKIASIKSSSFVLKFFKRNEIKETFIGFTTSGLRFKVREWIAIIAAALAFAVSLSYIYLSPEADIVLFFVATSMVNIVIYAIRHLTRLLLDKYHNIQTEYKAWYIGAIITAVTAWLGNAFSLAGYIVAETKKEEHQEGHVAFTINIITFAAFIVLFIMNLVNPSVILQMAMLLSIAIVFLQMLPFSPFEGIKILKWKPWLWWLAFPPITLAYIVVSFIL